MRVYDKVNYEFDKPSGMVQSDIYKIVNKKKVHYDLSPIQFDALNLMMYKVNEDWRGEFGTTENIIEVIKRDDDTFEKKMETCWYELTWDELYNFTNRLRGNTSKIDDALCDLKDVKFKMNIFNKNKNLGQSTFSPICKYAKSKKKIKFKIEPELIIMILLQQPTTDESYAELKLKIQAQNLKTVGAKRLYEYLKDWSFTHTCTIEIDDLKTIMNVDKTKKSNKVYATLHRDHIKKAVDEINDKSDMIVSYEPIKEKLEGQRKQATKIKFNIHDQPKSRLQELGLVKQPITSHKLYDKSKANHDKKVKNGYQVRNEELWIETDIAKNEEQYEAENKIDKWLKETDREYKTEFYFYVARQINGCDEMSVFIDDYRIKSIRSRKAFTNTAVETVERINCAIMEHPNYTEFYTDSSKQT
jgi:hypothetical protein